MDHTATTEATATTEPPCYHEARLQAMFDMPELYHFAPEDLAALRWALALADSLRIERAAIKEERRRLRRAHR